MDYDTILDEAQAAAYKAILGKYIKGDREQPVNCGFAWVVVDGRGSLVNHAKKHLTKLNKDNYRGDTQRYGSPNYPKGWAFWGPGRWPTMDDLRATGIYNVPAIYTQDMDFKYAGAKAFADVLVAHGIPANVRTRLD